MTKSFKGRMVIGGATTGAALVSSSGFNPLAAYCNAIVDKTTNALCADRQNPDLLGKDMAARVLCVPSCIGSTTAGPVWEYVASNGIAPKALLLTKPVDSLTAGGMVLAKIWIGEPIVLVDDLGEEFLSSVRDGDILRIEPDGRVWIDNVC
ncbi:MAG TPA: DUF126 domain-containing protein [Steroidobacter sp.]|uniref:aconitase X swivel domain-containing protein n=1 Tax=Steroidobacter sp. TaxID=1978227 RepID=UPI002ED809CD